MTVVEPQYEYLEPFKCEYKMGAGYVCVAIAGSQGKFGLINDKTEWLSPAIFDSITVLHQPYGKRSVLFKIKKDGKWGVMYWHTGQINTVPALMPKFDAIRMDPYGNFIVALLGSNEHLFDLAGTPLASDPRKETVYADDVSPSFTPEGSYFRLVAQNGRYGLIDRNNIAMTAVEFDTIQIESSQYYVKKDGYWGILDQNFNYWMPPVFNKITKVQFGLYYAEHPNGCKGYFTREESFLPFSLPPCPPRTIPYPVSDSQHTGGSGASFPGGMKALEEYYRNNAAMPVTLVSDNYLPTDIPMQFIVEKDGSLDYFNMVTGRGTTEQRAELTRLFNAMPRPWTPGVSSGYISRSLITLTARFE